MTDEFPAAALSPRYGTGGVYPFPDPDLPDRATAYWLGNAARVLDIGNARDPAQALPPAAAYSGVRSCRGSRVLRFDILGTAAPDPGSSGRPLITGAAEMIGAFHARIPRQGQGGSCP